MKAPLLLVHGKNDRVVDVAQRREMFGEMEDEGNKIEYIELENETHYLMIQKNRNRTCGL